MAVTDQVAGEVDALETSEWLEALDAVVAHDGPESRPAPPHPGRGARPARRKRADRDPQHAVRQHDSARARGEAARAIRRWSAGCARSCAGTRWRWSCARTSSSSELGGHIASFQSLATLYEVGFNHFWRAPERGPRRRPRVLPGPLLARQLRARVSRGPADRGAARRLSPGGLPARRPVAPTRTRG